MGSTQSTEMNETEILFKLRQHIVRVQLDIEKCQQKLNHYESLAARFVEQGKTHLAREPGKQISHMPLFLCIIRPIKHIHSSHYH